MKRHVHKYFRVNAGKTKDYFVYRCAIPDCSHYIQENFILYRMTICWECGEPFPVNDYISTRKIVYPKCNDCRVKIPEDIGSLAEEILKKAGSK